MENVLVPRCIKDGKGLVIKEKIDCEVRVIDANGNNVEPIDCDGVFYVPCNIGDRIMMMFGEVSRTFKVVDIERSGHFFVCEIIYGEEEKLEMELMDIAEQVKNGTITTNMAHLKADQLIMAFLYKNNYRAIADAFNKIPKYYE
jgi:hypothetical protein